MKLLRRRTLAHKSLTIVIDDDASVTSQSSTIRANVDLPKKIGKRERTTRVSFDESCNVYQAGEVDIDKDELKQQWYSSEDMKQFKSLKALLAREIYQVSKTNPAAKRYSRTFEKVYESCCAVDDSSDDNEIGLEESDRKELEKWISVSYCRIGLERSCIRKLATDKRLRRRAIVRAVLGAQEEGHSDERIRQASLSVSRASCLFAMALAKAQASHQQC